MKKTDETKKTKKKLAHHRSKRYLATRKLVDSKKSYPIEEAVKLLREISQVKFDATVELHCNLTSEKLAGELALPHGTGKTQKVMIASDEILAKLNDGIIDFDILISEPRFMPKLAKFAKFLGPKGLMPNPKTGTISTTPEEAKKKMEGGAFHYKSEAKAPLLHLIIGKLSFKDNQLVDNITTVISTVLPKNLSSVYLCSSMSPSIKLQLV
jgi:large subunit ribosomal protein L1